MAEIDLGRVVGPQGEQGIPGPVGPQGPQGPKGESGKVDGSTPIDFTTPDTYVEPKSGDSVANLFGRFKRWLLDISNGIGVVSTLKTPLKTVVGAVNGIYDSITVAEQDIVALDSSVSNLSSALANKKVGKRYGDIAFIESDGVMEIGRYLDFHNTDGDQDYDVRFSGDDVSAFRGFIDKFRVCGALRTPSADSGTIYNCGAGKMILNVEVYAYDQWRGGVVKYAMRPNGEVILFEVPAAYQGKECRIYTYTI